MNAHVQKFLERALDKYGLLNETNLCPSDVKLVAYYIAQQVAMRCRTQAALVGISNWENEDISWAVEYICNEITSEFNLDNNSEKL